MWGMAYKIQGTTPSDTALLDEMRLLALREGVALGHRKDLSEVIREAFRDRLGKKEE